MTESLAVYIHWPFCLAKCPYCDFNSHVRENISHTDWEMAYQREIAYYAELLGPRHVPSIFFGGGTPSLMRAETVETVINAVSQHWSVAEDVEITLEANPTSVEAEKFRDFRKAGVNRVSLGVQSLRDEALQFLGREHSAQEALAALDIANETFDRTTFDLIYARPGQSLPDWQAELTQALGYATTHMSLYQLTIEPGTIFYNMHKAGKLPELDEDAAADMFAMTQAMMADAGLPAYEISNHARPGNESRHNLAYWNYQDYAGIGPGAHGRLSLPEGRVATRAHRAPEIWLDRVRDKGLGAHPFEVLNVRQQQEERVMMGLRLTAGIPISPVQGILNHKALDSYAKAGFLAVANDNLRVTEKGHSCLNRIILDLLA